MCILRGSPLFLMDVVLELLVEIACAILELVLDMFASEWVGFLGASTLLVVSLGRIKRENDDWLAMGTGVLVILAGIVVVGGWFLRPVAAA